MRKTVRKAAAADVSLREFPVNRGWNGHGFREGRLTADDTDRRGCPNRPPAESISVLRTGMRFRASLVPGFTVTGQVHRNLALFLVAATTLLSAFNPLNAAESERARLAPSNSLTLEQALEMAEQLHPQLAEGRAQVEAAAGRAQQAGAFPNPEAIVGAQQIPLRSGAPDEREVVAGIAQPIPLGGRLDRAQAAEALEREVRVRGLEVVRRDLHRRIRGTYATALYQAEAAAIQSRMLQAAEAAVATSRARVDAGDASFDELARAEMDLAEAQLEVQRSESLHAQAMTGLLTAIGDVRLEVRSLAGNLDATFAIPTLESLADNLAALPEVQLAEAELRAQHANIALAKAERIPDVRVELLYHRLGSTREDTLDVGLSIPLPVFNRNQGRLREVRAAAAAAEARSRAALNNATLDLRQQYGRLHTALAFHRAQSTVILPQAELMLRVAEARHAAGDLSLAELLPERLEWAAAQLSHLESLRDVMQAWNELVR